MNVLRNAIQEFRGLFGPPVARSSLSFLQRCFLLMPVLVAPTLVAMLDEAMSAAASAWRACTAFIASLSSPTAAGVHVVMKFSKLLRMIWSCEVVAMATSFGPGFWVG